MLDASSSPSASLFVREFALNGLAGARIDEIAARTRSSKRMIYYYFGDKDGFCLSALENAYRTVREGEGKLDVEWAIAARSAPSLVEFTFDHHNRHGAFIRMVMIENIHHGEFLERSKAIRGLNVTALIRSRRFTPVVSPMGLFGRVSIPPNFTVGSARSVSSTSRTGRRLARFSAAMSTRRKPKNLCEQRSSRWCSRMSFGPISLLQGNRTTPPSIPAIEFA
jgi:AcrR family transcriptional regulator